MNRRERESRRKKKRQQKQQDARSPRTASVSTAPAVTTSSLQAQLMQELATAARTIGDALTSVPTESTTLDAAVVATTAMDTAIGEAWSASGAVPACRKGCSYCCRGIRVEVTPPEAARAIAFARANLPPETVADIAKRAAANAPQTHGKSALDYPAQLPCTFLGDDGECLVYEARPILCRQEHSLDVADCERAFTAQEAGGDSPILRDPQVSGRSALLLFAYRKALAAAELDASSYELQEAVHIAFSSPTAFASWVAGDRTFDAAVANNDDEEGLDPELVPLRLGSAR